MRLLLFLMLLSLPFCKASAQVFEQESIPETVDSYKFKKVNLDAKVGIAFPIRDFADSDFLSDESGSATAGASIGFELNAKPVEIVGFGLDVSAVFNGFNTAPYEAIAENDSVFSGIESGNYFNLKILGVFSIGVANENVEAELKLMGGPMYSRLPEQTLTFSYSNFNIRDTRGQSNSLALCAGIGFSSRYYIKSFYLKTFADYTSATVIHEVSYVTTGGGRSAPNSLTFTMSWMTIGAGIGIRF